jgi:hypothetical protein
MHAIFGILKFWNFFSKILKFQILEKIYLMKSISKLEFRVLIYSNKRCILIIVKKWHTQNFYTLKFFEQKFCKTQISKLEMTITLANCKLRSKNWFHYVRIVCIFIWSPPYDLIPNFGNFLKKISQKLLKIVSNGHNFVGKFVSTLAQSS